MRIEVSSNGRRYSHHKAINASTRSKQRIFAADEDEDFGDADFGEGDFGNEDFGDEDFGDDSMQDTLEDMADNIEDMQEDIDDIQEDDVTIDMDNNISDHYIAECDACHGIFISAMLESDQDVEKITGICPLCEKESDQYLKWVIKDVE